MITEKKLKSNQICKKNNIFLCTD